MGAHRWYVLAVLLVIFALNFVDRQIIVVLAPYIKEDLSIGNAQIGLLYGTSFAVFYSICGIPLAKLADGWNRKWTLGIGVILWSFVTALSGLAGTFGQLLLARMLVGIGEAAGQPAAVSMLGDYFPKHLRGTALGIYMFGMYIGWGCSLAIGGLVIEEWCGWFGLEAWQGAFLVAGIPGLIVAIILFLTVREPERESYPNGQVIRTPVLDMQSELAAMIAPWRFGLAGTKARMCGEAVKRTAILAGAVAVISFAETQLRPGAQATVFVFGDVTLSVAVVQWSIVGIGVLLALNWTAALRAGKATAYKVLFGRSAFPLTIGCCGLLSMYTYTTAAFVYVYGVEYVGLGPSDAKVLGLLSIISGGVGMLLGGIIGDVMKRYHPAGRILCIIGAMVFFSVSVTIQFSTTEKTIYYIAGFLSLLFLTCWPPLLMATGQDLVTVRTRGVAVAVQTLATALIGLAMGPYLVGVVSELAGSLRTGVLSMLFLMPVTLTLLWKCAKVFPEDERAVAEMGAKTESGG